MKKILVTNKYSDGPKHIVYSTVPKGFELIMLDNVTKENLIAKVSDIDYILASGRIKIDNAVLKNANKLKMIQRTGVGLDSIDIDAINSQGVSLYINQGINSDSVSEHALLLILACLRRLPEILQNTKSGNWIKQGQGVKTRELKGKNVGIIGMGNIGQKVARLLNAFGANVLCYSVPELLEKQTKGLHVNRVCMDELLKQSDVITLHCPLTDATKEIIQKENLDKMKDGVIIINTARGGLINDKDLYDCLQSGKVSFAGLDVFNQEPPTNSMLIEHPHVICTPHIAGVTYDSFLQMMRNAMRNIELFDQGKFIEIERFKYN